jgi:hypothetical protein
MTYTSRNNPVIQSIGCQSSACMFEKYLSKQVVQLISLLRRCVGLYALSLRGTLRLKSMMHTKTRRNSQFTNNKMEVNPPITPRAYVSGCKSIVPNVRLNIANLRYKRAGHISEPDTFPHSTTTIYNYTTTTLGNYNN